MVKISFHQRSVFLSKTEQLGLGCGFIERVVGEDTFAVLLADDFITDQSPGATVTLLMLTKLTVNHNFPSWRLMIKISNMDSCTDKRGRNYWAMRNQNQKMLLRN